MIYLLLFFQFLQPTQDKWQEIANIYSDGLTSPVDTVFLTPLEYPLLGQYCPDGNYIKITEHAIIEKLAMEMIYFHEIGHAFGLPHTTDPNDIMYFSAPKSFARFDNFWYLSFLYSRYFAQIDFYIENPEYKSIFLDCEWRVYSKL